MKSIAVSDLVRVTEDFPNDAEVKAGDIGSVARLELVDGAGIYYVYFEGKGEVRVRDEFLEVVG
jgi:hypothetical protein